eukprot:g17419.t1
MASELSLVLVATLLSALCTTSTAIEYTVATCADLADVDDKLVTGLNIDSSTFVCDEYTRFRVRNTMTLKATGPAVAFSNFSMKVLGALTVEPDVSFTGVVRQVHLRNGSATSDGTAARASEARKRQHYARPGHSPKAKNGGVLSVAEGATDTFMGTSNFTDNSVVVKDLCDHDDCVGSTGRGLSYVIKKGGAVHNKGTLSFEGDASFSRNSAGTRESTKGGAISNTGSGSILFKGYLTMEDNEVGGTYDGAGASVYNRGDISVDGDTDISGGRSPDGGGVYQTKIGTITFNGFATFANNYAWNVYESDHIPGQSRLLGRGRLHPVNHDIP